jgi:hypothetical protein
VGAELGKSFGCQEHTPIRDSEVNVTDIRPCRGNGVQSECKVSATQLGTSLVESWIGERKSPNASGYTGKLWSARVVPGPSQNGMDEFARHEFGQYLSRSSHSRPKCNPART